MKYLNDLKLDAVRTLLETSDLPTSDIEQNMLEHFVGIETENGLTGLVGLEVFPPLGLLRSLVVSEKERGKGLGIKLVDQIENHAHEQGLRELYLLTTTAEAFFQARGYQSVDRDSVPNSIKNTSEFSSICPASATVMKKQLA